MALYATCVRDLRQVNAHSAMIARRWRAVGFPISEVLYLSK